MLTSRMIEAFRAVIINGSISAAADYLHISQPAISRLIKDMEAEVGFKLFDRRRGRVFANEDALALYEEVHRFFSGIDQIQNAAERIRQHDAGTLRIACMPAVGLSVMPRAIARFRNRHPAIKIDLHVVRSPTVIQFLAAYQCDVGIVESAFSSATIEEALSFNLKTVCILPPGHALIRKEIIQPQDLAEEPFISLGGDSRTRLKIDAVFSEAGVKRSSLTEAPITAAVCSLVQEGCGVAIVDPMTARNFTQQGIAIRPFEPSITFSFKVLLAPRVTRTSLAEEFLDVFSSAIHQEGIS